MRGPRLTLVPVLLPPTLAVGVFIASTMVITASLVAAGALFAPTILAAQEAQNAQDTQDAEEVPPPATEPAEETASAPAQGAVLSDGDILTDGDRLASDGTSPSAAAGAIVSSEPSDLAGVWLLNEEESETLIEKVLAARPPDSMRGGDLGEARQQRAAERGRMRQRAQGLFEIQIEQQPDQVTIRYDNGRERVLYTDGRPSAAEPQLDFQEVQAAWEDGALVIRIKTSHGEPLERWQLSATGAKLRVTTEMGDGERIPHVSVTRVYDPKPETPQG
ncbi:MAG: hypothetical protein R3190_12020 [Thermoanaerobaculia bacterium]|nr:hypothetical protein [Thermoanaerobaculia bacterium]